MVGGNGPNVTWRLAARHADELNLDGMTPDEVVEALPVIRSRCEEIDRDPASLARLGPHLDARTCPTRARSDPRCSPRIARSASTGSWRSSRSSVRDDGALESLADDARDAGLELA